MSENKTVEEIYLDKLWTAFNGSDSESEFLLSAKDQEEICTILKEYKEVANTLTPRNIQALSKAPVMERQKAPIYNVMKFCFSDRNKNAYITTCHHRSNKESIIFVGSPPCETCKNFIGKDYNNNIVSCSYGVEDAEK